MSKIFLARHGESQWNILSKIQGQRDIPLTDKGIKQAEMLGRRLLNENIKKIYSSDLSRAYTTAKIISDIVGVDIVLMKEFREINFGVWEGMTIDEIKTNYSKEFEVWRKSPEKLNLKNAETIFDVQKRAIEGINKIIKKDDNVLIVSHGVTIKTIILGLLDINISNIKNLKLGNASLSIIEFREYNNVLETYNNTDYIKEC